jgi:bifunctional UDP-N-acetylglucosamine pyrophosphorylase / glucosamine-1-phosphate N-acetyltransferase
MKNFIDICLLAAGKGTRLKLNLSKALLPMRGKLSVDYCLESCKKFLFDEKVGGHVHLVLAYQKESVESHLKSFYNKEDISSVEQKIINGTGGAIKSFLEDSKIKGDFILVSCVDTPALGADVYSKLWQEMNEETDLIVATFKIADPTGYGRIVKSAQGLRIVEEKEADLEQKKINEVNAGVYLFRREFLEKKISKLTNNNKAGEYYLTDILEHTTKSRACCFPDPRPFVGINTIKELSTVEQFMNKQCLEKHMANGVRLLDPERTWIEDQVEIEAGVTIYPDVYLLGKTKISSGVSIEPNVWIKNVIIEKNAQIKSFSHLEDSHVGQAASIGPFARLRPGANIGEEVKIGNFVEIKKATLKKGAKASHLAYIGDAEIGENTNIGCGVITVNYDGKNKHKTVVGDNSFIGSDCQLVAPITIGDECFVACGSTITKDLEKGDFAIARSQQSTKKGLAKRFLKPTN